MNPPVETKRFIFYGVDDDHSWNLLQYRKKLGSLVGGRAIIRRFLIFDVHQVRMAIVTSPPQMGVSKNIGTPKSMEF